MANQATVEDVIARHETTFDSLETISVRAAPNITDGRPDFDQCHIEVVARRPELLNLPSEIDGVPVRKLAGTMEEQALRYAGLTVADAPALSIEWRTGLLRGATEAPRNYSLLTYRKLNPSKLVEVNADCALVLNVSPDAGWPVLEEFLGDRKNFNVAMYDLTAPHIVEALEAIGKRGGRLNLCLGPNESLSDGTKRDDIAENTVKTRLEAAFDDRFQFAWASVGVRRQWPSAYHIKVAVRDDDTFWLSSGNWQSSNQPNATFAADATSGQLAGAEMAKYNREWHVVVDSKQLSDIFGAYIDKDRESSDYDAGTVEAGGPLALPDALIPVLDDDEFMLEFRVPDGPDLAVIEAAKPYRKAFPAKTLARRKRRIMPLLTPDNYIGEVLDLIRSAKTRIWFQNQSLSINANPSPMYRELLDALREKASDIDDARIFFRDLMPANTKDQLRVLDRDGFPMGKVRVMKNVHTKGIIVDDHLTLIGSHNWTNEGTNYNRDASLIIEDHEVNEWFAAVLDHDWQHLAYRLDYDLETPSAVLPLGGEVVPGTPERIDPRMDVVHHE